MTFDIYLKDPQGGVAPSLQKKTPLVAVVSHRNCKYKKSLGISVLPRDYKKGKVKDPDVNLRIRKARSYLTERLTDLSTPEQILEILSNAKELASSVKDVEEVERAAERRHRSIPTFSEYLPGWVSRGGSSVRQRRLFQKNVERFLGEGLDWDDIDDAMHFRLVKKMEDAKFAVNYQRRTVGQLKTVMEEGLKLRYHTCLDYKKWKVTFEHPDTVYLTSDEVDRIWALELESSMERKARDLFIIGVYTVARFSDYSRVSDEIIHGGMIHFVHQKTSTPVVVPVAPRVREVLDRYGGCAPRISSQKFNENIKEVCRKAGITALVERRYSEGARHVTERVEKYRLVTSHTARRTGATLLRLAGASMREIMLIGGWSREKTLEDYLRMTREDNAEKMKDNPFFK